MPKIPIGKHRGLHFKDVPKDYLKWVGQDFDEDLLFAANHYLNDQGLADDVAMSGGRMILKQ